MEYNGWSNFVTWKVACWVDSDEVINELVNQMKPLTVDERSQQIEGMFRERSGVDGMDDIIAIDLMEYALGMVNWFEIAEKRGVE